MTIPLFDVQCGFGSAAPGARETLAVETLLEAMDGVGVERALARMLPAALEIDIPWSNAHLYAACEVNPRLVPCPIVAPNTARDLPTEAAQADEAARHGAGAVVIRPHQDYWSTEPWCSDRLFRALEVRRFPLFCLNGELSYDEVASIAGRYPGLPLILAGVDYRSQRVLLPLLEAFPNIYMSVGSNYLVNQGIEQCVDVIGARRLLFGTGFPDIDMTGHVSQLMYANITDEDKRLIGAGNLERLMQGVQR